MGLNFRDFLEMASPRLGGCECEHKDHFDSPRGYPCPNPAQHKVATDFGTFNVCDECLKKGHILYNPEDLN